MKDLLYPRSVAVIGASEKAGAPAGVAFRNLIDAGFADRLYPVHPSAETIHGIRAFPSVEKVSEAVDCVVVGLSADKVVGALEEAATAGTRAAVVLASGFAELGDEGKARQAELVDAAKRFDMAVCGPNCLGLINVASGIPLYSASVWKELPKGDLAILSHSGSGAVSLSSSGRLGLSHVISAGNSAVCDMADYLMFMAEDESTRAAAIFMETIRDTAAFERAMAAMHTANKPVAVLRVGRSKLGAAASAAHTGSLVSSDEAFATFFRRNGVVAVDDMDELIETACLMTSLKSRPKVPGVGLINVSGGEVAHACDIAEGIGLEFPKLSQQTLDDLTAILPSFATPSNPLDATGAVFADPNLYPACIKTIAADPSVGILAVVQDAPLGLGEAGALNYRKIAGYVADYARDGGKPIVFISNLAGGVHPVVREPLDEAGVPVLNGTRAALKAVLNAAMAPTPTTPDHRAEILPQSKWVARLKTGRPMNEHETKAFLRDHGVPTTRESIAKSGDEAARFAAQIGFPVVLKVASDDLPHKTEVGGVALNLRNEDDVRSAYERIVASVRKHAPTAYVEGISVQEMIEGGVEAIVGLTRHHPFGLAVVAGSGGVFVELLKDAAVGLPPLDQRDAKALIASTRLGALLDGFRGAAPADGAALEDLIVTISEIATTYCPWIEAMDLNPVAVLPKGSGVCVLDALLVPVKNGSAS